MNAAMHYLSTSSMLLSELYSLETKDPLIIEVRKVFAMLQCGYESFCPIKLHETVVATWPTTFHDNEQGDAADFISALMQRLSENGQGESFKQSSSYSSVCAECGRVFGKQHHENWSFDLSMGESFGQCFRDYFGNIGIPAAKYCHGTCERETMHQDTRVATSRLPTVYTTHP
jgi:hypothetical protein